MLGSLDRSTPTTSNQWYVPTKCRRRSSTDSRTPKRMSDSIVAAVPVSSGWTRSITSNMPMSSSG